MLRLEEQSLIEIVNINRASLENEINTEDFKKSCVQQVMIT